jgi:hypothetical protein
MPSFSWNPAAWIAQNWIYLVGWISIGLFLYKGYIVVNRFASYGTAITELRTDMETIKTSHLPHVQEELVKVNLNIAGLRDDLKEGLGNMRDDLRLVLARMP